MKQDSRSIEGLSDFQLVVLGLRVPKANVISFEIYKNSPAERAILNKMRRLFK